MQEPSWHTWKTRPTENEVHAHVRTFFEAVRAKDARRAFALCPHHGFSAPYAVAPDKESIKKAWKLMQGVLTGNKVAEKTDNEWYTRLDVASISSAPDQRTVHAKLSFASKPTQLTALFYVLQQDDRWQVPFYMLRVLAER